ncbi:MAG TPA: ATP synthase F1 subunit epsilon [bacterium]|nr:ATP synthase F1 subunit epsilon [bacterium]HPJ72622.1 ATP synthase F1 subunit epsilon [bacterium]HPQ65282.1 ATP synthase F1 subunit epsilon [bacterium]
MTAATLKLRIVSPRGVLFDDGDISSIVAWGAGGKLEILPGHTRFLTSLRIEEMRIRKGAGRHLQETIWAVSGGFLEVDREGVTVTTTSAETSAEIDVERARQSRERMLAFLKNGEGGGVETLRARWALKRSEIRLKISTWREGGDRDDARS